MHNQEDHLCIDLAVTVNERISIDFAIMLLCRISNNSEQRYTEIFHLNVGKATYEGTVTKVHFTFVAVLIFLIDLDADKRHTAVDVSALIYTGIFFVGLYEEEERFCFDLFLLGVCSVVETLLR